MTVSAAWVPVGLLALALLLAGWVATVRVLYRIRGEPPRRLSARCSDGWELALFHRPAVQRRFQEPIVLCHGLCANHFNFDFDPPYSLAHRLAEDGFECFSVDLRGTRDSARPPRGRKRFEGCADDHVRFDAPAAVARALELTGAKRAFWIGHSLGGLIGYAAAQSGLQERLAGLVSIGAPVFFQYRAWIRASLALGTWLAWPRAFRQEWLSSALAPFLGYVTLPLSDVIVQPRHVPPPLQRKIYANLMSTTSRRLLLQFRDWVASDAFRSFDGRTDWRAGLRDVTVPVLVTGGSADRLAAPGALEAQHALLGSKDRTLRIFGRAQGDSSEYGHGDLIFGEHAPREVYGFLSAWLQARATGR